MKTLDLDAITARDKGIQQSSETSGDAWKAYAVDWLERYCMTHETVFVDDIWTAGLDRPKSPRALGAVMQHAIREHWITPMVERGYVLAKPSRNSNMQLKPVWRSAIYGPTESQGELF